MPASVGILGRMVRSGLYRMVNKGPMVKEIRAIQSTDSARMRLI
jgi:DNA-binding transcriptional regulator PaaX